MVRLLLVAGAIVCATGRATMQVPAPAAPGPAAAKRHVEEGRPLVRIYPPSEYGGGAQNWAIVQDARGVIYVGSGGGVQEYDGVNWRIIETPKRSTVRSLAIGEGGRIYVAPPDNPSKAKFRTREAMVIDQRAPFDPAALASFISQLQ